MSKPSEKQLIDALGQLLCEYSDIDAMLDGFAQCSPEGMTPDEAARQRASNKARDSIAKLYRRAAL